MRGVPIFPPGTNGPGSSTSTGDIQHTAITENNQEKSQKNEKSNEKTNDKKIEKTEKNKKIEKENTNESKNKLVTPALGLTPDMAQQAAPTHQRVRKLPISINTSSSVLQTGSKRRCTETPVTPSILSRLSGTLSSAQNELVSKFGKTKNTIYCEHCTNIGCISITSLRHDSDFDENEDIIESTPPLEFQCIICGREQSENHMHQALGIMSKKSKNDTTPATIATFTPLPGTPASMVSAEDNALSEQYQQLKHRISCIECAAIGTMVKFGFTQTTQPRPRFQCSHCKRIFNISVMADMMSELSIAQQPPQSTLSPPTLEEDIEITDAQPTGETSVMHESQEDLMPTWIDENITSSSTSSNSQVIQFLLDSVKSLTAQATENQAKFDYINTLIERNEQLKNQLKEQKKENELQKK
ncbi:hypothetical protein, partial, partial [Parasitella parasitica]